MKHPVFQQGFRSSTSRARQYYLDKWAKITGPDGETRMGQVTGVIISENVDRSWSVRVYFRMNRLDGHPEKVEPDWARAYFDVHHKCIDWDVSA